MADTIAGGEIRFGVGPKDIISPEIENQLRQALLDAAWLILPPMSFEIQVILYPSRPTGYTQ
jgi:hypothetical protein